MGVSTRRLGHCYFLDLGPMLCSGWANAGAVESPMMVSSSVSERVGVLPLISPENRQLQIKAILGISR